MIVPFKQISVAYMACALASRAVAAQPSAQDVFAASLAAAAMAQEDCNRPDEVTKALRFIDQFGSGFNSRTNKSDAAAVVRWTYKLSTQRVNLGRQAWCEEYAVKFGSGLEPFR